MKLHFLGGADEVGASSLLLEIAGKRVLVDAGIRMGGEGSRLPDLEKLQELGGPDLILVTHAHADHIGALPLVHLAYPTAPVVTTAPTKALMEILLGDALKIMELRWEREEDIPLYPPHAVEGLLSRIQPVGLGEEASLCGGALKATFTLSGHVLGACSIALESAEGLLFLAGDYSVDPQRTVDSMTVPRLRPDVVVTESTYGNRLHADRRREEARLVETVKRVTSAGGKVLVPAFALGRAQEVLLILLEAKRKGELGELPIYADGLVRRICMAYPEHGEFLHPKLRKLVAGEGNPFFGEGKAIAVLPTRREEIVVGPPCVLVSSSGMLTGGPSSFYASHLVRDPRSAILITGYQDEESPGHALLNLADERAQGKTGRLTVAGERLEVVCEVGRYGLSAHADAAQMASVVSKLAPRHVVLVHGDEGARAGLAQMMPASMGVHLPKNGENLSWKPFRKAARALGKAAAPVSSPPPSSLDPVALHAKLLAKNGAGARLTLEEMARAWFGEHPSDLAELEAAVRKTPGFARDPRRPELFRVLPLAKEKGDVYKLQDALDFAKQTVGGDENFHKTSNKQAQRLMTLHFHFPEKAKAEHRESLREIAEQTGWTVEISPQANQRKLDEAATELVLAAGLGLGKVSVFPNEPLVRVKVTGELTEETRASLEAAYLERTGRKLELATSAGPLSGTVVASTAGSVPGNGRLEQNQAFALAQAAFAEIGVRLYRCGSKDGRMELAFISPQVAARHQTLIEQLEARTGWPISVRQQPNPIAITEVAKETVPASWGLQGQPSLFLDQGLVRVTVSRRPPRGEEEPVRATFERLTGFHLQLKA